jgi:hypothetical protein
MVSKHQAVGRGIRAHVQALIREGGEQGMCRQLALPFETGVTARGLSWKGSSDE